jgi:hypothetical protein
VGALPGLVFNASKPVAVAGGGRPVRAGRLESTMQNVVDHFPPASLAARPTFAVTGPRRMVTSSAKKARASGGGLAQTPDGSFLDLVRNGAAVLRGAGVAGVPADAAFDEEDAVEGRLPLVFLFHPALGPLWDVVRQKVAGGRVARGSELVLDLAEARLRDVALDGSLRILADAPLGHAVRSPPAAGLGASRLVFSDAGGRARLERVAVTNAGVDWAAPSNVPWRGRLARAGGVVVRLAGRSEFDAADVAIDGPAAFDVPDGCRLTLRPGPGGATDVVATLTRLEEGQGPGWGWRYGVGEGGRVELALIE